MKRLRVVSDGIKFEISVWQEPIRMRNSNVRCSAGMSDFGVIKNWRKANNMRGTGVSASVTKARKSGKEKVNRFFNVYYKLF